MDVEKLREYCLSKPGVEESFPFGEDILVFKVGNKIFALLSLEDELSMNLKCDPERAIELREQYSDVIPGYHMNKQHWNTVMMNGDLSQKIIFELIDHSYQLVFDALPKKKREDLKK